MEPVIAEYLIRMELGDPQSFENMAVIPLFSQVNHSPVYLTLHSAMEQKMLTVTEVSSGGSVPQLRVKNDADAAVLLLDGEELAGAKQNRVLNTSILIRKHSEREIPVTCVEQGRWAYDTPQFYEADTMMSHNLRTSKLRAVTKSLESTEDYRSDQGQTWAEISEVHSSTATRSSTGALRDAYRAKADEINKYMDMFKLLPGQRGLLVLINGEVVGFDMLSRGDAYEQIHVKLLKSYTMDAIIGKNAEQKGQPDVEKARAFLDLARACEEKKFKSIGYGYDYRYEGKDVVGSALALRQFVVHTAFSRAVDGHATSTRRGLRY